ncbi:hypothetical protein [Pseudofulvibacter geojedonensis]|uniref:Uncharacterized protein n=1 Tax=Pseudofulvibacter geojedonensis TaxID=1123758 RepID=A0ABW3I3L9_9FLAO
MKNIVLIVSFLFFALHMNAQDKQLAFDEAKINVFFKGFKLLDKEDYSLSLSPNYIKDNQKGFSIYEPITHQNLTYNPEMIVTNGSLSLDNLTRNIKRDSFNPHGATDFKNALGIGVANTILQLLQK